jgi:hypothetical protein
MQAIRVFIFLFSISVSALVIPSVLPKVTMIGIFLLVVGILLTSYENFQKNTYLDNDIFARNITCERSFVPFLAIIALLILLLTRTLGYGTNISSNIAILIFHVSFLIFIINSKRSVLIYIKYYIYYAFIMSMAGLIANALVSFGIVDAYSGHVNIYELTNGSFRRDIGSSDSYVFPYYLGFILTGSGKLSLAGFEFFRISGWAHEPTSATLFVVPSMILLLHTKIVSNKFIRLIMFGVISLFWFFAMSVGSALALILIYFIVINLILYEKIFPTKISLLIVTLALFMSVIIVYYLDSLLVSSLLVTKFDTSSETMLVAVNELFWFNPENGNSELDYFLHLELWFIIFIFFIVVVFSIIKEKSVNVFSIILLYIIIHTMKGSQMSVFTHVFTFFWFYIAYYSIPKNIGDVNEN